MVLFYTRCDVKKIFNVPDYFTLLNGKQLFHSVKDDLGTPRTIKTDINNLRLLRSIAVLGLPDKHKTCIVMKTTQKPAEPKAKDNSKIWFQDVHKVKFRCRKNTMWIY